MNNSEPLSCVSHALFLGSLRPETSSEDITSYFSRFGSIIRAKVIFDVVTLKSKKCGILFCANLDTKEEILRHEEHFVLGKKIRVSQADSEKKGTKKVHTSTLYVSVPDSTSAVHLDSILRHFSQFGLIERYQLIKANPWSYVQSMMIYYIETDSVSQATKSLDAYLIDGSIVECVAVDTDRIESSELNTGMMQIQMIPAVILNCRPSQTHRPSGYDTSTNCTGHQKSDLQAIGVKICNQKTSAMQIPTNYVHIVEFESDDLFRVYCTTKHTVKRFSISSAITAAEHAKN